MNRNIHIDKITLETAIQNSVGIAQPNEEVEAFLSKLNILQETGKYSSLLGSIRRCNDKSNFISLIFETTFAYQFEINGVPLNYEVKQDTNSASTIDFHRQLKSGTSIYFEARLIQLDSETENSKKEQLQESGFYSITKTGERDHEEIIRIQRNILSKVQKKDGTPIKFLHIDGVTVNIVVVDVTDTFLGTIDQDDCLLATRGDAAVDVVNQRGIFGIFQEPQSDYTDSINSILNDFAHLRKMLSGVMFLFKEPCSSPLDYKMERYIVWNLPNISVDRIYEVTNEIDKAIPCRQASP